MTANEVWDDQELAEAFAKLVPGLPGRIEFTEETPAHCHGVEAPCDRTDCKWGYNSTLYHGDANHPDNWSYLCPECREKMDEHWTEMWAMYYSMVR